MDQTSTTRDRSETGASANRTQGKKATPDEAARRDLIAWCERHGLPVPPERGTHGLRADSQNRG